MPFHERGLRNEVSESLDARPRTPSGHAFEKLTDQEEQHNHRRLLRRPDQHGSDGSNRHECLNGEWRTCKGGGDRAPTDWHEPDQQGSQERPVAPVRIGNPDGIGRNERRSGGDGQFRPPGAPPRLPGNGCVSVRRGTVPLPFCGFAIPPVPRRRTVAQPGDLPRDRVASEGVRMCDRQTAGGDRDGNVRHAVHPPDRRVDLGRAGRAVHAANAVTGLCRHSRHGAFLRVQAAKGSSEISLSRASATPEPCRRGTRCRTSAPGIAPPEE